jgi:phosphoribosyl 1,2-cyclic phosphodiesterase
LPEITVFCSDSTDISIIPAMHTKEFLERNKDIMVSIVKARIPSDDVYRIEQFLEKEMRLNEKTTDTRLILLHITTGTKLMLLAASNIARNYPNV